MSDRQRFKPGPFRRIVKDTAAQIGIRNTQMMVLYALLDAVNYQTGQARTARATLARKLGRTEDTIKIALRELRATGIIEPIAYARGGKGRSPVYEFRYTPEAVRRYNESCKTGAEFAPVTAGAFLPKGGENPVKQGRISSQTGANIAPPSTESSSVYSEEEKATASRRENLQGDQTRERVSPERAAEIAAELGFPMAGYTPRKFGT